MRHDELYDVYEPITFDPALLAIRAPIVSEFMPKTPGFLVRMLSKRYAERVSDGQAKFEEAKLVHRAAVRGAEAAHDDGQEAKKARVAAQNAVVDAMKAGFERGEHDAVVETFKVLIARSLTEEADAVSAEVGYAADSRHLVVDLEMPGIAVIPDETAFKYIKAADRIDALPRTPAKKRALYAALISQVALKCVDTVYRGGRRSPVVDCLTLNGMLDALDPATGRDVRVCLLSVRITSDDFDRVDLTRVQPDECLRSLKASVSRSPAEMLPVKPIVELDMVDPRFIASSDVLSSLDTRPNLMELTPGEFESLITNLFAKMGLDTRQTQASRDGGVDCVAFDQRPVFGGKVVIQAKRYKNTVGVSAVRDLFGTVQNEGASKGLLVTTSGYGKASFEFAKGKPLELLDGANLLHLLQEHAGIVAKIVMPEEWKDLPIHGE